jgi:hypothetical protein
MFPQVVASGRPTRPCKTFFDARVVHHRPQRAVPNWSHSDDQPRGEVIVVCGGVRYLTCLGTAVMLV